MLSRNFAVVEIILIILILMALACGPLSALGRGNLASPSIQEVEEPDPNQNVTSTPTEKPQPLPPPVDEPGPTTPVIYETRPDGAVRLTNPPPGDSDQNPAFSPDGARLIFTRFENGYNEGPAAIYLLDLADGKISLLAASPDSDNVNLPGTSWNAAAGRITFSSDREDIDEIWTMTADGRDLFRVTHHTTVDYFIEPTFSPDGQWIVFESNPNAPEAEQRGSIWKIRADGAGLSRLTVECSSLSSTSQPGKIYEDEECADGRQPNWSPTGERILFQRRQSGSNDWNLYTMTFNGSDVRPLTTNPSDDTDASWSPDGQWIVYSSNYGNLPAANIFIIPADGGDPIRATHDKARYDGAPSWSPDGRWIAFESHPGDEDTPTALWLIAAPETRTAPPALPSE